MTTTPSPLFMDPDQPIEVRVEDLVSRMTLEEKVLQMMADAPAIERLSVPAYHWWNECLHGVGRAGLATVFPQAIGLAATWDRKLLCKVAQAIATEARAKHHHAVCAGNRRRYFGLTFWTPNINIFRDPRWGRGQETYGEDPYLTARLGVEFVKGLQGNDPKYLKVSACAKHYAVHSGPEEMRHGFDAQVSPRDLWETYLPAFEALVREAGVASIMGAYNRTNGEPCCASPQLLQEILRRQWGFAGYFVSDCGAIDDIFTHHKTAPTPAAAAAVAVKAGCDLNCGDTYVHLVEAVKLGLLQEEDLDRSLQRLFSTRMRLGLFDPPERVPYAGISYEANDCPEHARLAIKAARECIVLLKNQNNLLPLCAAAIHTMAVIGPVANDLDVLLGNYHGQPSAPATFLEGIRKALPKARLLHVPGCRLSDSHETANWLDGAVQAAQRSDVVIMCLGLSPLLEGEEGHGGSADRSRLDLPEVQMRLLKAVHKSGKPIVLVLTGGSALDVAWAEENVPAILLCWYPGQAAGTALADVLLGKYNPAGRLPVTFYRSVDQLPPFEDYRMRGRTYRFFEGRVLYPFGFGLSYTRFSYGNLEIHPTEVSSGGKVWVSADVTNAGSVAGDEVVQVYVTDVQASVPVPLRQLAGFARFSFAPGQKRRVTFVLNAEQMACVGDDGRRMIEPGYGEVTVGGGQTHEKTVGNVLVGRFAVRE